MVYVGMGQKRIAPTCYLRTIQLKLRGVIKFHDLFSDENGRHFRKPECVPTEVR
jgi:hypothetical protein